MRPSVTRATAARRSTLTFTPAPRMLTLSALCASSRCGLGLRERQRGACGAPLPVVHQMWVLGVAANWHCGRGRPALLRVNLSPPPPPPQRLLKNDRIPHGWVSVCRYEEIEADFKQTYPEGETALRTAFLINCGAAEDVRQLLHLDQRPNVRVVIIDAHRCAGGRQLRVDALAARPAAMQAACAGARGTGQADAGVTC